jgi:hypothetical protein
MSGKVSFATVRKLGLQLGHVEKSTTHGKPSLKVHGKMFVCMASHKSAEPDSLVLRTDFEQRAELLAANPETYYITDHYKEYPAVLVRLPRVTPALLRDLLGMAHRFVVGKASHHSKSAPSRS